MELKDFSRSTLGKCIQPAPMTLTNVVKDLTQLKWQACPVVSIRSFGSTQYNSKSPTGNPKASVDPAGLKSGKKKNKKTASVSNMMSRDQSGRFVSSGGGDSSDQKDNGALMIVTCGTSSSTVPEEKPNSANKRKRKVNQKTLEYLSGQNMPNLSLELGIFA